MTTLPLYDRNGIFVRRISVAEAAQMVDNETAEAIQPRGFRNRPDLEWEGIRLNLSRNYNWSPASITAHEMQSIVGAVGSHAEQVAARAKVLLWRSIH